jgi:hypothetical protein
LDSAAIASTVPNQETLLEVKRIAWALDASTHRIPSFGRGPCLAQALAGQWLLRRRGLPAELCIGVVRRPGEELLAHAWVEIDGMVVIGGSMEALAGFTRLPDLDGKII